MQPLTKLFIAPFDTKEAAAASNNGAITPDLSLIVKARHDSANYVYSLLIGYQNGEHDENGLYINSFFSTGRLAMAPLLSEGMVEYDGTMQATVENMSYDVVNFLQWAAEPELERRHKLGLKIVTYFIILTVFFVLTNNIVWSQLYKKGKWNFIYARFYTLLIISCVLCNDKYIMKVYGLWHFK